MFVARMRDLAQRSAAALELQGHSNARQFGRILKEARVSEDFEALLCNLEVSLGECGLPELEREVGKLLADYEDEMADGPSGDFGFDEDDPFE